MTPSAINTLFGTQANPASAKPAPAPASGASAFGEVLSRELGNRQNGARAETPAPAITAKNENRVSPSTAQPAVQPSAQPKTPARDNINATARQDQQRTQDRKDTQGSTAPPSGDAAANQTDATAPTTVQAKPGTKEKAQADEASNGDAKSADVDTAAIVATPASAELLALVNSLTPKPAAAAAETAAMPAATATAANANSPAGKIMAARDVASKDAGGAVLEGGATDPAFDTLLAEAAKVRGSSDTGAAAKTTMAATPSATAATAEKRTTGAAQILPAAGVETTVQTAAATAVAAAVASAKAEATASLAASTSSTAKQSEPALFSSLPGTTAIVASNVGAATGQPATDTLAPHVGTTAWDNALGQKVVWMAAGAQQSASLTLNPPELGPLQVVINVNNTHAEATFTAAQPEVRQALEAALPRLKEMLSEAGISLGQTSVNAGSPNQQGAAGQQQARDGGQRGNDNPAQAETIIRGRTQAISGGNGLVDTFA